MGFFGRIAAGVAHGVRKIGEFGSAAVNKIGQIKNLYDRVNNATDGIIGETLEKLPVVGPALAHMGKFLNDSGKVQAVRNGLRATGGIADSIDAFGRAQH